MIGGEKGNPHVRKVRSGMSFSLCLVLHSLLKQIACGEYWKGKIGK